MIQYLRISARSMLCEGLSRLPPSPIQKTEVSRGSWQKVTLTKHQSSKRNHVYKYTRVITNCRGRLMWRALIFLSISISLSLPPFLWLVLFYLSVISAYRFILSNRVTRGKSECRQNFVSSTTKRNWCKKNQISAFYREKFFKFMLLFVPTT